MTWMIQRYPHFRKTPNDDSLTTFDHWLPTNMVEWAQLCGNGELDGIGMNLAYYLAKTWYGIGVQPTTYGNTPVPYFDNIHIVIGNS